MARTINSTTGCEKVGIIKNRFSSTKKLEKPCYCFGGQTKNQDNLWLVYLHVLLMFMYNWKFKIKFKLIVENLSGKKMCTRLLTFERNTIKIK